LHIISGDIIMTLTNHSKYISAKCVVVIYYGAYLQ